MAPKPLTRWLRKWRRRECGASLLASALCLAAGLAAVFVLFLLFWFICFLFAPGAMANSRSASRVPLALTSLAAAGLFIDSLHSRRDDISNVWSWLVRESFGIGPRLLLESCRYAFRTLRLASLDLRACADVLAFLAAKRSSASRDELRRAFPDFDWQRLVDQLRMIEGVLFFRADFSRVTLSQPLRLQLRRFVPLEQQAHAPEPEPEPAEPAPVSEPEKLSSHDILGVSPSATLAEIKAAYRTRIKECHPDRFVDLDETSRNLAEEWTKALNAAYAELSAQHSGRKT